MFGKYANEYINKEFLMDKISIDCNPENHPRATPKDVFICALGIAETFPASPVRSVVYGQWEETNRDDIFRCSNCGIEERVKTVMGMPDWKYCPNCAAKMLWEG